MKSHFNRNILLLKFYNGIGCLTRSVGDAEAELNVLRLNGSAEKLEDKVFRPSSHIQKDLPAMLYGNKAAGVFIHPDCNWVAYKQMTFSNHIPDYLKQFKETPQSQTYEEFLLSNLNKQDGERKGKLKLKPLTIAELSDKRREKHDKQAQVIPDKSTTQHLLGLLLQAKGSQASLQTQLTQADLPEYIKKQILKKYDDYLLNPQLDQPEKIIAYIQFREYLKNIDARSLKSACMDISNMMENVLNEGVVDVELLAKHCRTDAARGFLKQTINRIHPNVPETELTYPMLHQICLQIIDLQTSENIYFKNSTQSVPAVSECLAIPVLDDILALRFDEDMFAHEWLQAEKLYLGMKAQGVTLDFFSYKDGILDGPFSYKHVAEKVTEALKIKAEIFQRENSYENVSQEIISNFLTKFIVVKAIDNAPVIRNGRKQFGHVSAGDFEKFFADVRLSPLYQTQPEACEHKIGAMLVELNKLGYNPEQRASLGGGK